MLNISQEKSSTQTDLIFKSLDIRKTNNLRIKLEKNIWYLYNTENGPFGEKQMF